MIKTFSNEDKLLLAELHSVRVKGTFLGWRKRIAQRNEKPSEFKYVDKHT